MTGNQYDGRNGNGYQPTPMANQAPPFRNPPPMTMAAELTSQEAKVAQMLGDAWNAYLELPKEHPMEQQEFCTAIHACQDMVLARCGRRALNRATSGARDGGLSPSIDGEKR